MNQGTSGYGTWHLLRCSAVDNIIFTFTSTPAPPLTSPLLETDAVNSVGLTAWAQPDREASPSFTQHFLSTSRIARAGLRCLGDRPQHPVLKDSRTPQYRARFLQGREESLLDVWTPRLQSLSPPTPNEIKIPPTEEGVDFRRRLEKGPGER